MAVWLIVCRFTTGGWFAAVRLFDVPCGFDTLCWLDLIAVCYC